ncbi:TetR/AcrR family transcriptional regulator [Clostridium sp. D2Q-11]|uniref:TetR/AcrR family transcriptional regulator n=1 Tax=Anaeromonas frigoriresistens TaxID=2683708 RepID=A0A942Z8T0_9FIRM|nr:TetR/AcrR family transcriptional regulator [Anaeromonas frigoriresistens]MBS4538314.1 TetR/AcrR family transcriptional regulator [Anaeromonas frigoriresistens]
MPKIINDIEERIFVSAFNLFSKHGYKKVDMKIIAEESGIAVGTLYNYHPNKKSLFIDVFNKSWAETFEKLDLVLRNDAAKMDKINSFVRVLYDEILKRKGMGNELIKTSIIKREEGYIKGELLSRLKQMLSMKEEVDYILECKYEERLLETILVSFITMMMEHPDEEEDNINYLSNLLWNIYVNIEHY